MERVIVTGANGFIGRNFIKFLSTKSIEVYAVDITHENSSLCNLDNVHLIECSLEELHTLKYKLPENKYDAFYHFAWAGVTKEARTDYIMQTNNARYTCDAAVLSRTLNCKKFIATGTITEKVAESILTNHYTSQNLIYGLSKLYTHNLLDIVCRRNNINYVWARLSNIYGGDNTNGNLISYTLNEFNEGRVPEYGPSQQPYNFTYIDDVIEALYLLGNNMTVYNEYFIGNGECMKLKDYLKLIAEYFNKTVAIGKREDDGVKYDEEWFNIASLTKEGFSPSYSFIEGLKKIDGGG